jgi:hypothetical protein
MRVINVKPLKLRGLLTVLASVAVLALGQVGNYASAATTAKTTNNATNNANSLKISPLRTDITVTAGQTGTVKVRITNLTSAPIILKAIENDFVAGDEKGTPALILDENSYAPSHSLKRFMVPVSTVTISPSATQEVVVTVRVPKTAQAGGYFGAIRFAPASATGQALDVASSVTSLILLTVPGPTVEQMLLTNFDIQQNGGTASNFRNPNNLGLLIRFQNKGNLQEQPFGQINVQKGKKVVYTSNFNQDQPRDNVLPDSYRRWAVPLKNLGKFGKYTVSGTFGYGTKGQTINIEKTVWIVPTSYILGIVGAVLLLVIIGGGTFLFLRSYKRKILQSSRRRY